MNGSPWANCTYVEEKLFDPPRLLGPREVEVLGITRVVRSIPIAVYRKQRHQKPSPLDEPPKAGTTVIDSLVVSVRDARFVVQATKLVSAISLSSTFTTA